jgi:hypothetical protein
MDAVDELADRLDTPRVLLLDGDATSVSRAGWTVVPQCDGTLARRLDAAFHQLGPGIIVGMETPHVVARLDAGIAAVQRGHDAIGLTVDGGYWAIGLHRVEPHLFSSVPMSTSHTGINQLRALHRAGRTVYRLPFARDLDTIADLRDAAQRRRGTPRLTAVAQRLCSDIE